MFDCIVVGAGPAGASAAYHLAKLGRSVLLLEKESLPRYKPCGGGVSPQIAEWFDFDFSPAISLKVNSIRYTWKMGDPVEATLETPEPMWMVRRDVFDHFLVRQAQGQGAQLRDSTPVRGVQWVGDHWQVDTDQEPLEGQYLIAADGAKGQMAKWLGFKDRRRRLGGALEVEAPAQVVDSHVAHFEFGMVRNGYIWNFPKADGYSIGIGTFRGGDPQDFKGILQEYATIFGIDIHAAKQFGHPLCLWDGNQKLHTRQALLAGEAACVVDPFTAEGIRPSIFSAIEAAKAVHKALAGDLDALPNYSAYINESWGADMAWAQRLAGVFYRFPETGYQVGVKRPSATAHMGKIMCGEERYSDVVTRALKRMAAKLGQLVPGFH